MALNDHIKSRMLGLHDHCIAPVTFCWDTTTKRFVLPGKAGLNASVNRGMPSSKLHQRIYSNGLFEGSKSEMGVEEQVPEDTEYFSAEEDLFLDQPLAKTVHFNPIFELRHYDQEQQPRVVAATASFFLNMSKARQTGGDIEMADVVPAPPPTAVVIVTDNSSSGGVDPTTAGIAATTASLEALETEIELPITMWAPLGSEFKNQSLAGYFGEGPPAPQNSPGVTFAASPTTAAKEEDAQVPLTLTPRAKYLGVNSSFEDDLAAPAAPVGAKKPFDHALAAWRFGNLVSPVAPNVVSFYISAANKDGVAKHLEFDAATAATATAAGRVVYGIDLENASLSSSDEEEEAVVVVVVEADQTAPTTQENVVLSTAEKNASGDMVNVLEKKETTCADVEVVSDAEPAAPSESVSVDTATANNNSVIAEVELKEAVPVEVDLLASVAADADLASAGEATDAVACTAATATAPEPIASKKRMRDGDNSVIEETGPFAKHLCTEAVDFVFSFNPSIPTPANSDVAVEMDVDEGVEVSTEPLIDHVSSSPPSSPVSVDEDVEMVAAPAAITSHRSADVPCLVPRRVTRSQTLGVKAAAYVGPSASKSAPKKKTASKASAAAKPKKASAGEDSAAKRSTGAWAGRLRTRKASKSQI